MEPQRKTPLDDTVPLRDADPEVYALLEREKDRQRNSINLIASENFVSKAVMETTGSVFTNKYAEGQIGKRYYGGCDVVDDLEALCMRRALKLFNLDEEEWGVNVQPLSGSPANLAVYMALLNPHDKILGLRLTSGGHLTHGFYSGKKNISATSVFYSSLQYGIDEKTGLINYDEVEYLAKAYIPKIIIAGASCYSRYIDYRRFREISDKVGAYLMADVAHILGLIAAGVHPSPFEYCHVVTSTTHKTFKGPRAGIIFFNKKAIPNAEETINSAVFPTLQGGPHEHTIASIAVQLNEAMKPSWKKYMVSVVENARVLAAELGDRGFKIYTGGTDNHTVMVGLQEFEITGSKLELVTHAAKISLSKSTVPGDTSPSNPSGVRLGTAAMTARGAEPDDMKTIAKFIHDATLICVSLQEKYGKKLVDFKKGLENNPKIDELREKVLQWVKQFPCVC